MLTNKKLFFNVYLKSKNNANFLFEGGDDINQLVDADEKEFKEIVELVGMASKPLHVKRLRKAIDEYKSSNGKLINGWFFFENILILN